MYECVPNVNHSILDFGMGNGAWGIGNGALGIGNGALGIGHWVIGTHKQPMTTDN
ncbi:MAG: hypothetical protein WBA89_25130 [Microcoleus sp.]